MMVSQEALRKNLTLAAPELRIAIEQKRTLSTTDIGDALRSARARLPRDKARTMIQTPGPKTLERMLDLITEGFLP